MEKTVKDIMSPYPVTCHVEAPLKEVLELMLNNNFRFLVVIDEMGDTCGVITEMLILNVYPDDFDKFTAEDVMVTPALTTHADTPVSDAVDMMKEYGIHHLVINHDTPNQQMRPIGVLSTRDILRYLAGTSSGES